MERIMLKNPKSKSETDLIPYTLDGKVKLRKLYRKPALGKLGDLRTITLGVSNGLQESGNEGTHKNF